MTTSDDGGWGTMPPPASTVTRTGFVLAIVTGVGFKARYMLIRHGWHRRKRHL